MQTLAANLASNVRRLRAERDLSQQRMAEISGVPRPTWASLETGAANPTLAILSKVAAALQVSIEELITAPLNDVQLIPASQVRARKKQGAILRPLLPVELPGFEISRLELAPDGHMVGVPHTSGTREYLNCETGSVKLVANGEHWVLTAGDMLVFRGDQRHSYHNENSRHISVAVSIVCFALRSD